MNLDLKEQFTPSVLLTLEDEIIPHSILKLCINSYINNENWDPKTDPFLSPIIASDEVFEILKKKITNSLKDFEKTADLPNNRWGLRSFAR